MNDYYTFNFSSENYFSDLMLPVFLAHVFSKSDIFIKSPIGLESYNGTLAPGSSITINVSVFDFYIVFNVFPSDLTVVMHNSNFQNNEKSEFYSAPKIPLFLHLTDSFGYCKLTTKKGGVFSISYGSLPNICRNGIIFSNKNNLNLDFNHTSKWPFKIGRNDDICIVFTSQEEHNIMLYMKTEECCDKLISYDGFVPNFAYSGTLNNIQFKINSIKRPSVFRFISDDKIYAQSMSMVMSTNAQNTEEMKTEFYQPLKDNKCNKQCRFFDMIEVKVIIIVIGSIIGFELIMGIAFYFLTKYKYNYFIFPSSTKRIEQNPNDVFQPPGYYALDSILSTYD